MRPHLLLQYSALVTELLFSNKGPTPIAGEIESQRHSFPDQKHYFLPLLSPFLPFPNNFIIFLAAERYLFVLSLFFLPPCRQRQDKQAAVGVSDKSAC